MLEKSCYLIDVELAGTEAVMSKIMTSDEYKVFVDTHLKLKEIDSKIENFEEKLDMVNNAIQNEILKGLSPEETIKHTYNMRIELFQAKIDELVSK